MEHRLLQYHQDHLHPSEQFQVAEWIGQSDANRKVYEDTIWIWENSKLICVPEELDLELAWQKFKASCH